MKIFYMNDENQNVTVQTVGQLKASPTNPHGEPTIEYFQLKPQEGRLFEIDSPEGSIPWVKRWENRIVLLSYVSSQELADAHKASDM